MKAFKNSKGFTVFELLAVFAIIAILLTITTPKIFALVKNSKYKADLVTISNIENADKEYFFINKEHSFNVDIVQTTDNFQDSLDNLAGYINNVHFQIITNVKWSLVDNQWQITYDYSGNQDDENEYPEWDNTVYNYDTGDKVVYNGAVFEARYWVSGSEVPGTVGSPWQEITTEWRNFNVYLTNDIVIYNGAQFKARYEMYPTVSNPTPTPGEMSSPWDEITTEWRSFNVYHAEDTVIYNGIEYRAKWYNQNKIPSEDSVWEVVD